MVMKKLGRGLDSLIEDSGQDSAATPPPGATTIACTAIRANPHQPRREFDDAAIEELASSIREHGVLQPVVVRPAGDGYELVAGERRLRACRMLGLAEVPAVIREVPDDRMLEIALVENIQREDLNPIEKAEAYRSYLTELGLTHQEAAERLGKNRSTVTNQLRLLDLESEIQAMVSRGTLSMGHARALLGVADADARREIARRTERDGLSVRDVERLAKRGSPERKKTTEKPAREAERSAHLVDLEKQLRERFATKVRIDGGREKGKIVLEYFSMEELGRLLEMLL